MISKTMIISRLFFFLIRIIQNIRKKSSNITNIIINPNGWKRYDGLCITFGKFAIYRVPPHNGQGFPVIAKYGHTPKEGIMLTKTFDIIGKRIT